MKLVIALLSDIQHEIEIIDRQEPDNESEFKNGVACGLIEGRLGAFKEFRNALIDVIKEQANEK